MTTTAAPARAHTATIVVVGPQGRLHDAAGTLREIDQAGCVQPVLISTTTDAPPVKQEAAVISGLKPEYLDNAIAALRLSSLPTVVWWRGGQPALLDGVAALADRVILDAGDAPPLWSRAARLFDRAAITDVRWARLTRWRAAMAHFFDLPAVRDHAVRFTRLRVAGADRAQCTLFAGWLDSSLGWQGRVAVEMRDEGSPAPMTAVQLTDATSELALTRLPNATCLETSARIDGHLLASRVVSLGDQRLAAVLSQELRVRSRDIAFERALAATSVLGL
jgi:glucose-6-phosphate dehydrogenase assembly protein OpcA